MSIFPGCYWEYEQHLKRRPGFLIAEASYVLTLVLPSQLHPPPHVPQAAPAKVEISSMVKPTREAEKARAVGVQ